MTPRFILAVTDFSSQGDQALARAALLSAEHGASLTLACVAEPGESSPADAVTRLTHHALQLSQAHGISARAVGRVHHAPEQLKPEVAACDLIVWGTAPSKRWRSFFLGQPVAQLLRSAGRPVLVVRHAALQPYRSMLVALDFAASARALTNLSMALSPTASVELFHAASTANEGKLRYAEVSDSVIKAYRDHRRRDARDRMVRLSDSFDTRRNRVQSTITHGDPARQAVVQQERSGADIIAVGKHPGSWLSERIFGSVAGRLLRYLHAHARHADVLVVPHDWQPAGRSSAVSRLVAAHVQGKRVRAGVAAPPPGPNPAALPAVARGQQRSRGASLRRLHA